MFWYLLIVYLHIGATVFLIGYTLFWTIMVGSLAQQYSPAETQRFLWLLKQTFWPPQELPRLLYRCKLPGLGWAALMLLMITGVALLGYRGAGVLQFFMPKLVLVAVLCVCQFLISVRPRPGVIRLYMGVALAVAICSVLLIR